MYTIKEVADMAGVSTRTLRHYDALGLLRPAGLTASGYRQYGQAELERLQEILLYRELGMELERIGAILDDPAHDRIQALQNHKKALLQRRRQLDQILSTLDATLASVQGGRSMNDKELFRGLTQAEEAAMEQQALEEYDPATVAESWKQWRSYSKAKQEAIMAEGNTIYQALSSAMAEGHQSPRVQELIRQWHRHMENFWVPSFEQLIALADSYHDDPRFKKTFDRLDPGLAAFMGQAVRVYVKKQTKPWV